MNTGIYKIENLANGKVYIGSSKDIPRRWRYHIDNLDRGTHCNRYLQSAWNLHGNFEFVIVEECGIDSLIEREQFSMDTLHPEYNLCPNARSPEGLKHTAEARANMSTAMMGNTNGLGHVCTPETRSKISIAQIGKIITPEARSKMSIALMGNTRHLGHTHSKEARAKMSTAAHKGLMGHPVSQEARDKISIAMLGNKRCLGYKHSSEARANMSAAQQKRGKRAC